MPCDEFSFPILWVRFSGDCILEHERGRIQRIPTNVVERSASGKNALVFVIERTNSGVEKGRFGGPGSADVNLFPGALNGAPPTAKNEPQRHD
jgi:hypothetical protein